MHQTTQLYMLRYEREKDRETDRQTERADSARHW